jgi:hypothetical protein
MGTTHDQEVRHIGRYGIQELDVGGVFDHAVWLLRDNLKVTVVICALIPLPFGCMLGAIGSWASDYLENMDMAAGDPSLMIMIVSLQFASVLTILIEQPLTMGTLLYAFGRSYLGHKPGIKESIRFALSPFMYLSLMATYFLVGMMQGIGICLCIVPGIIVGVIFSIAGPVAVFERANVASALERSFRLAWPNFFVVFFTMLALVALGLQGGILVPLQWYPLIFIPAQAIFRAFTYAVSSAVQTSLYFSLRSKQEAYDLDLLARVIDTEIEGHASAL